MSYVRLSSLPSPPISRVCNIPSLSGGLNIHDQPTRLLEDQSPEMANLWWKDGLLRSRPALEVVEHIFGDGAEGDCACYPRPYKGWYIFHRGTGMYALSEDLGQMVALDVSDLTYKDSEGSTHEGLPAICGSFFLHNGTLYYKTRGLYLVITEDEGTFTVDKVDPFCPTYLINAVPSTPGAGDLYQPLNRLNHKFYVTYSPQEGETTFFAPFFDCDITEMEVLDEDGKWTAVDHTTHREYGLHTFYANAKHFEDIKAGQNNVRLTFGRRYETDYIRQQKLLDTCTIATVYGGGEGLCVVLAGSEDQPNGYFWSANTDIAMDPTYFPTEHYNLAGDFSDPITAFGQQQNKLVVFQQNRIGGATFGTTEVNGRTLITMEYAVIHPTMGCDVPGSVQLIENNLVFANRSRGIFLLRDTTAAGENTVAHISDNVERSPEQTGLFYDLKKSDHAVSVDDGARYWLLLGTHAWLWDYRLDGSIGSPRSLSWFYFDGLRAPACVFGENGLIGRDGAVCRFSDTAAVDFESVLTLPVRNFGTYEVRKNVDKLILALEDGAAGEIGLEYLSDFGLRLDPAPLICTGEKDGPFVRVFVRRPRCIGVRHFLCVLRSTGPAAFASAQIYYSFRGEER